MTEIISKNVEVPQILYHGTCKAFVAYALQNEGRFGLEFDNVSFTPELDHAKAFAHGWSRPSGLQLLLEYFGQSIEDMLPALSEPVILQFKATDLGQLQYRNDCGRDEYYVERGPVDIHRACIIDHSKIKNR